VLFLAHFPETTPDWQVLGFGFWVLGFGFWVLGFFGGRGGATTTPPLVFSVHNQNNQTMPNLRDSLIVKNQNNQTMPNLRDSLTIRKM